MGKPADIVDAVLDSSADAIAMADILHFKRTEFSEIRATAELAGLKVRKYER